MGLDIATLKSILLKMPLIRDQRVRSRLKANVVAPLLRQFRKESGRHFRMPALRRFKKDDRETFFGYYDIPAVDAQGKRMLSHVGPESPVQPVRNTPSEYGYFHLDEKNTFVTLGETTTWCWQMGARLRWLPGSDYSVIAVNKPVKGELGSILQEIDTQAPLRSFDRPLYDICGRGETALSLNFARLAKLRPGYGYDDFTDPYENDPCPSGDGVWRLDLKTGRSDLIVSLHDLANLGNERPGSDAIHYVNHLSFSPSGNRVFFLHIWAFDRGSANSWSARAVTCNPDGSDLYVYAVAGLPSHYCWIDDTQLVVFFVGSSGFPSGYYRIDDSRRSVQPYWAHLPTVDGHQTFSPDGSRLLTDKYPDRFYEQTIQLYSESSLESEFGPFIPGARYYGPTRCDLHPRWNESGRYISFDSTHENGRAVYLIDLEAL